MPTGDYVGRVMNEGMREYVRLSTEQIRQRLEQANYLTVDHRLGNAYLHLPDVTGIVPMSFVRDLLAEGYLERANADDVTAPIAIYRHAPAN